MGGLVCAQGVCCGHGHRAEEQLDHSRFGSDGRSEPIFGGAISLGWKRLRHGEMAHRFFENN